MKVKSESEVTQLCLTLRDPMDYSLPGSSAHGIFQARVLEWGFHCIDTIFVLLSISPFMSVLQYSCLENPMDRGACWAVVLGVAKGRT